MLEEAHRRNKQLTNIKYLHGDLRDMSNWHKQFDVAIATNSILPESIIEADKMVVEIFKSLKKGGVFVGVMPSIETSNYLARLRFDREIKKGLSEKEAIEKIKIKLEQVNNFDGIFGFMKDGPDNLLQKYFYRDEIEYMFKKAGFKINLIEKLVYSWKHCEKYGFDYFPKEKGIYDWFIIATREV